jgi:hypothetical protein
LLVMIGDGFHNFVDGLLIATAFMDSVPLGLITAAAIIAHEIPQELGDFVVLLHSGCSRGKALAFNLLSSLAMAAGALLAHFALPSLHGAVCRLLALACSSMIYVAVADLIPGLHRRTQLRATVEQIVLIAAGIVSIVGAHVWSSTPASPAEACRPARVGRSGARRGRGPALQIPLCRIVFAPPASAPFSVYGPVYLLWVIPGAIGRK